MEDNTQAVQALSKKDEAYVRIKDRIISGEYKPGSLLVERTLSDSLNMSRTPIRAALMDLCHTGLATFVPGKGIYVSVIGRRDIEEIYEIRALLDPAVLLSFMKQATRDQIAMLRTFADNMRDAVRMENTGMLIENDVNFHQYYTDYCGNARLADIVEEHLLIMKAIEDNDQAEAELQMKAHYSHLKRYLIQKLTSEGQL